jgi:hypothetical protein
MAALSISVSVAPKELRSRADDVLVASWRGMPGQLAADQRVEKELTWPATFFPAGAIWKQPGGIDDGRRDVVNCLSTQSQIVGANSVSPVIFARAQERFS